MLMKQIRQLSTDKDYDELIEKCRESIYRFEHIAETETPSFGNDFLAFSATYRKFFLARYAAPSIPARFLSMAFFDLHGFKASDIL